MKLFAHKHFYSALVVTMVSITPLVVMGEGKLLNPLANNMGVKELVLYLVRDILVGLIAPIVITLALLWSGFMFVTAQGNEGKLENAKRNFVFVLIGGVLLLGAYVILDVITNTVGEIVR